MAVGPVDERPGDAQSEDHKIDEQYLDELRGYRQDLLTIQKEQTTSYDKAILSLSGGALGVTIAFADKFGGDTPTVTWSLLASWSAFCTAICFNVLSYLFSSYDMEAELEKVRKSIQAGGIEFESGNGWRRATQRVNILALAAFILGVGLFGYHAYATTHASLDTDVRQNVRQEEPAKTGAN